MTDTSKEAVEDHLDISVNHEAGLIPVATQTIPQPWRDVIVKLQGKVKALSGGMDDMQAQLAAQEQVAVVNPDEIAKLVYEQMMWAYTDGSGNRGPKWVDGGNSFAQDRARLAEGKILSTLRPASEVSAEAQEEADQ